MFGIFIFPFVFEYLTLAAKSMSVLKLTRKTEEEKHSQIVKQSKEKKILCIRFGHKKEEFLIDF